MARPVAPGTAPCSGLAGRVGSGWSHRALAESARPPGRLPRLPRLPIRDFSFPLVSGADGAAALRIGDGAWALLAFTARATPRAPEESHRATPPCPSDKSRTEQKSRGRKMPRADCLSTLAAPSPLRARSGPRWLSLVALPVNSTMGIKVGCL
ncbi:unnamed protein product [Lampetra planeri]